TRQFSQSTGAIIFSTVCRDEGMIDPTIAGFFRKPSTKTPQAPSLRFTLSAKRCGARPARSVLVMLKGNPVSLSNRPWRSDEFADSPFHCKQAVITLSEYLVDQFLG